MMGGCSTQGRFVRRPVALFPSMNDVLQEQPLCTALSMGSEAVARASRSRSVAAEDDGLGLYLGVARMGARGLDGIMGFLPSASRVDPRNRDNTRPQFSPGLVIVNALSERLQLETCRDGQRWRQRYQRGSQVLLTRVEASDHTGTSITYKVDRDLIPARFRVKNLRACISSVAADAPEVSFSFHDRRVSAPLPPRAPSNVEHNPRSQGASSHFRAATSAY